MNITSAGAAATVIGVALACAVLIPLTDTMAGSDVNQGIHGNADNAMLGQVVYGRR